MNIIDNFRLGKEKENFQNISDNIRNGIYFRGTNLWILIFAVFIASLGLNVNSTAVIIGAMLISPLMGPIMGLGFGMGINDVSLLKKSGSSFLYATIVSLITSTIYFLITPLEDAHSEILARTSPNIYDVLIAIFGGLAIMLAFSSKLKGNVIPGVAIATALMPPLCTAGYGLATLQFHFFFGAFYLFIINSVFIALSTLAITRVLNFPLIQSRKKEEEVKARKIVWIVIIITILPSIYFGYTFVEQNKFEKSANEFIDNEAIFVNDYLLKREIDVENKEITLIFGGQSIEEEEITLLKSKLLKYELETSALEIKQGFTSLKDNSGDLQNNQLTLSLSESNNKVEMLQSKIDSLDDQSKLSKQIYSELKIQYPFIQSSILQTAISNNDSTYQRTWIAIIHSESKWNAKDKTKIEEWLKIRINTKKLNAYFE